MDLEESLADKNDKYKKLLKFDIKSGCLYTYVREFYTDGPFDKIKNPKEDYVVHENGNWNKCTNVQKMGLKKIRAMIDAYNIIEKK